MMAQCLKIEYENSCGNAVFKPNYIQKLPFAISPVYESPIKNVQFLTKGEDVNTVYDLTLQLKDDFKFEPGDTIGILPCNDMKEVEDILRRLNLQNVAQRQYILKIDKNTTKKNPIIPPHVPPRGTLQQIFLNYLDIRSPPKKLFLQALLRFTTDENDVAFLTQLCLPKGSKNYTEFIQSQHALIDVLNYFPSCLPPVEILLEHLPALRPRPYSISSSPYLENEFHIIFSVVLNEKHNRKGVCSGWLENLIESHQKSQNKVLIPFYFRQPNQFRLPANNELPLIMIGAGTGLGPYLGFIQHRSIKIAQTETNFGSSCLIFGCRYSERDFLHGEILKNYSQETRLKLTIISCFSRDGDKKYVQDAIRERASDIYDEISKNNAIVYVCGDQLNMVKDVRNALEYCLSSCGVLDKTDKITSIEDLQKAGRYIQDSWI